MIIQTLNLIILIGKIYYSFWFSYIIFLIFIGGLFILFIYVISLTYNNKFFSLSLIKYLIILIFLIIILLFFLYNKNYFFTRYEINPKNFFISIIKENIVFNLKLYNIPNNLINLLLILYLLLLIIIVVKITNFFLGPIKSKF